MSRKIWESSADYLLNNISRNEQNGKTELWSFFRLVWPLFRVFILKVWHIIIFSVFVRRNHDSRKNTKNIFDGAFYTSTNYFLTLLFFLDFLTFFFTFIYLILFSFGKAPFCFISHLFTIFSYSFLALFFIFSFFRLSFLSFCSFCIFILALVWCCALSIFFIRFLVLFNVFFAAHLYNPFSLRRKNTDTHTITNNVKSKPEEKISEYYFHATAIAAAAATTVTTNTDNDETNQTKWKRPKPSTSIQREKSDIFSVWLCRIFMHKNRLLCYHIKFSSNHCALCVVWVKRSYTIFFSFLRSHRKVKR